MEGKKKKDEVVVKKSTLGREGASLKTGIIGLPNIGKRSTFNLLLQLQVPSDNSKDETKAKVEVADPRYNKIGDMLGKKQLSPPSLTVINVVELLTGAMTGDGLGNSFLSQIASLDAIFHLVRAFEDEEVQHNLGDVDPVRDLDIVHQEFIEKDKTMAEKYLSDADRTLKKTPLDKDAKEEKALLEKVLEVLKNNKNVRDVEWTSPDIDILNKFLFLTSKPVVYLINMDQH
jgi:obg-like ATPase 1